MKYTSSGTPVAKFSLATNERYKDRGGEWQDRAEWHNIVAWQRLAEISGEYLRKGSRVYLEGRMQTSSWEDRESGEKKYRAEIVVRDLVLLGGGNGDSRDESQTGSGGRSGFGRDEDSEAPHHEASFEDSDIPF